MEKIYTNSPEFDQSNTLNNEFAKIRFSATWGFLVLPSTDLNLLIINGLLIHLFGLFNSGEPYTKPYTKYMQGLKKCNYLGGIIYS